MKKLLIVALFSSSYLYSYQPGKYQDLAAQHWQSANDAEPQSIKSFFYKSLMFYNLFEFELALTNINKALELSPEDTSVLKIKGEILQWIGNFEQAVLIYQKLIDSPNNKKEHYYNLYACLTALGQFSTAVKALQTWKLATGQSTYKNPIDRNNFKEKSILIIGERGFGDQIQYLRFTSLFKKSGAKCITYATSNNLISLFSSCPSIDAVIDVAQQPYPKADFIFKMDELLFLLNVEIATITQEIPYLFPPASLIERHSKILQSNSFNVGICWQAKQGMFHELTSYCNRSIPLSHFKNISTLPGVQLYSLQKGPGAEQLAHDVSIQKLPDEFDECNEAFIDTAAFIKNLDLIITADTSIAHLAGALGKNVWVLLPYTSDVRWMLNRADTPWYPTMKLFRQKSPGNWNSVMQDVISALHTITEKAH